MKFFFYPLSDTEFKKNANGSYVRTLVFDPKSNTIVTSFCRKVNKVWSQTCKNNIETDHRIKLLSNKKVHVYSWVCLNEEDFSLPSFEESE